MDAYSNIKMKYMNDDSKCEKAYYNFAGVIFNKLKDNPYLSLGVFELAFDNYFEENVFKKKNTEEDITNLIKHIEKILELKKGVHYILIPLQSSAIKNNFRINNVLSVVSWKNIDDMYKEISDMTNIDVHIVKDSLIHTQHTRCHDFMKANMLLYKVEGQTDNIKYPAIALADYLLNSIRVIHQNYEIKVNVLTKMASLMFEKTRYVSIISNDSWRCGNAYQADFNCSLKYDLDFLKNQEVVNDIMSLNNFMLKKNKNKFEKKLLDAIIIYGKAEYESEVLQDRSIAFILYFTSLESLISEGYSSKRLCLKKVIPELIESRDKKVVENEIDELYKTRSAFLHAGISFDYTDGVNACDKMSKLVAKVIVCSKKLIDNSTNFDIDDWEKYINKIYKEKKDNFLRRLINKHFRRKKSI